MSGLRISDVSTRPVFRCFMIAETSDSGQKRVLIPVISEDEGGQIFGIP